MRKFLRRNLARVFGLADRSGGDDLVQEFRAHLDMATDEYVRRGMSPEAARRAARIDAGSLDAAMEAYRDQRSVPLIESLRRDLRFAWHAIRRNPRFGVVIAVTLALGIGLNTAIFTVVDSVLRRPLPYGNPDALVSIGSIARGSGGGEIDWMGYPSSLTAWRFAQTLEGMAVYGTLQRVVAGDASPESVSGATATANLLSILQARPQRGRWFSADETSQHVVVISDALWRHQFNADTAAVGRSLQINGSPYTVVGVMAPHVGLPAGAYFWIPLGDPFGQVVARIRDGETIERVDAELTALSPMREMLARQGRQLDVIVIPLHDQLYGSARTPLAVLFGAGVLLLLITCANVTNLVLARTIERRRELAMRIALGASQASITSLIALENLLLTTIGGGAGLLIAWLMTNSLVALAPPSVALASDIRVRLAQVVFVAIAAAAAGVMVSVAPVIVTKSDRLSPSFHHGSFQSGRARGMQRLRHGLVVTQLALTVLLMTGAGLLIRSVNEMTRPEHLGFSADGIVIARVSPFGERYRDPAARETFRRELLRRLAEIPGVQRVSVGPAPLVSGSGSTGYSDGFNMLFGWSDPAAPRSPGPNAAATMVWVKHVDPSYRETFGIRLEAGRWFTPADDSGSTRVALINQTAAKLFFGSQNPIGRELVATPVARDKVRPVVIGVVGDVLQRDLTLAAHPEVYLADAQQSVTAGMMLAIKSSASLQSTIRSVRKAILTIDPALAASRLEPMSDVVDGSLARHRFVLRLLSLFASLGLLLGAIGLYGLVSYLVAQRTTELGVRIALGATRGDVISIVLTESARLAIVGIAIGIPLALMGSRLIASLLYEVRTYDLAALAVGPLALAVVAIAAAWVPARRAASLDPAVTLRSD